jgi:DNA polymerase-3 subunit delta
VRLAPGDLPRALQRRIEPIYVVFGDEPLQISEAVAVIRVAARGAGFSAWELFFLQAGFNWSMVRESTATLPLFGESRVVDVRVPDRLDAEGMAFLTDYASAPSPDCVVLVSMGKLTLEEQKKPWFRAVEQAGASVVVRSLAGRELLQWLDRRMSANGLLADQSGLAILASRVEGNLLAAAQEIDKLKVLYGAGRIEDGQISTAVADSARFDVFDLVDAVLGNRLLRAKRILDGLLGEGMPPAVVLWGLAREVRNLAAVAFQMNKGKPLDAAFASLSPRVHDRRRPLLGQAVARLDVSGAHEALLLCAVADRTIKGETPGDAWDALMQVCVAIADPNQMKASSRSEKFDRESET